ncbi:MAG: 4Fe-4S binding protein [Leptolyngbyaceae cyanobacterium MO_188.B28]|nr:4Fe-4S binding protein [Leptolyngbyaceae cyanobacterium MO_188.B28]
MLAQVPEKRLHQVRFVLAIGWLIFIWALLLGDSYLPGAWLYHIGPSLFWGIIPPLVIVIVLVLGHEAWRRLCPLAFISQITTAFGLESRSQVKETSWLARHHLYLQFGLFFVGLNCRVLFFESDRTALGIFLLFIIMAAITVVYLFGGRTWCHYFCPMSPVQTVFTGPRGLLGSEAHKDPPGAITQSMCRIWDLETGEERNICVGCKSPCFDIDAEYTYWQEINKPGASLIRYGYLGLVIGFFGYLFLYAGDWDTYYSALWGHDINQAVHLFDPGFTIASRSIPIPKIIACPSVLAVSAWVTCLIGARLEKMYAAYLKRRKEFFSHTQIRHRLFSGVTLLSFNIFLICSAYPFMRQVPEPVALAGVILVMLPSSLWLHRTWNRDPDQYFKEGVADSLRRTLKKLPIDLSQILPGRPLDKLDSEEVYALAQVLPGLAKQYQYEVYRGVLEETLEARRVDAFNCLDAFRSMRQKMGLSDEVHHSVLMDLCKEKPYLCYPQHRLYPENADRPPAKSTKKADRANEDEQATKVYPKSTLTDDRTQIAQSQKANLSVEESITMRQSEEATPPVGESITMRQAEETAQPVSESITMRQPEEASPPVKEPITMRQFGKAAPSIGESVTMRQSEQVTPPVKEEITMRQSDVVRPPVGEPITMRQIGEPNQIGNEQIANEPSQRDMLELDQEPDDNILIAPVEPDDEPTLGARNATATAGDETTQLFRN